VFALEHAGMRIELGLCSSTAIATEDALNFSFNGPWKSLIALLLTKSTARWLHNIGVSLSTPPLPAAFLVETTIFINLF